MQEIGLSMPLQSDLPPLRDVIARLGLSARKGLGQHFLLDLNLTGRIARAAGPLEGYTIYEVGPGPGGLTRALLSEGAHKAVVVEADARFLPALEEIAAAYPNRLTIIHDDARDVDERKLLEAPVKAVSNLPYNAGTALVAKWLEAEPWPPWYESLTVMLQREVAERIAAVPNTKAYGRLSVLAQWRCNVSLLFDIPPEAFTPRPKVTSTLLQMIPLAKPRAPAEISVLKAVVAAAFGQRRKMLRSSLKSMPGDPTSHLSNADIAPTNRAEDLTVEQFCALARSYASARRS